MKKNKNLTQNWSSQGNQAVRIDKKEYQKSVFKAIFSQFFIFLLLLIAIYFALAAMIMRVTPTPYGFVPSKNNTFEGGILPKGAQVHVNLSGEVKDGVADRLKQSIIPQKGTVVLSVLAGPIGTISHSPFSVDGLTMTPPVGMPEDQEYLNDEYIGICIKGECQQGATVLFSPNQILGVLLRDQPVPEMLKAVNRPDTVSWEFLSAAHANSPEVSCKLVSGSFLKTVGGIEGCKTYVGTWRDYVGRGYDINNLVLNVVEDTGKVALVEYDFVDNKSGQPIRGSIKLVNPNGEWLIDNVERK